MSFCLLIMSCGRGGFCMVSRYFCGRTSETSRHLFIDCQWVHQIWVHFQWILGMSDIIFLTPHALLLHWQWCAPSQNHLQVLLPYFILWQVWKAHNTFRFDSQSFSVDVVILQVILDLKLCLTSDASMIVFLFFFGLSGILHLDAQVVPHIKR